MRGPPSVFRPGAKWLNGHLIILQSGSGIFTQLLQRHLNLLYLINYATVFFSESLLIYLLLCTWSFYDFMHVQCISNRTKDNNKNSKLSLYLSLKDWTAKWTNITACGSLLYFYCCNASLSAEVLLINEDLNSKLLIVEFSTLRFVGGALHRIILHSQTSKTQSAW